jgi:phage terminase large subunit-like protein
VPGIDPDALSRLSPEEQKEVARLLAELDDLRVQDPLQFFHPHPRQVEFLDSEDPCKAFLGGNRSGKTTAGIVDDIIQAVDRDSLPEHLQQFKKFEPPFFCRIIAPDFVSTMEGVIFHKLREWLPKGQLKGGSWDSAYDKQRRLLNFKNGSRFAFMTFEQELDKFSGAALHRVHYDEEPPEEIRTENQMRLIDYGGQEMFTMTPLLGISWMYDAIYEKRHLPGFTVVQVDMDDNPHLNQAAKERLLEGLSEEERVARKEGRFVHFGGMVFAEFRDRDHVCSSPDPRAIRQQSIVVGIDPGIRWTGVTFVAFDGENHALVFDELYLQQKTIPEVADDIRAKLAQWGVSPDFYVIDPSARNRTQINADAVEAEFQRQGIYCVHGQNDVESGILTIKRRLQGSPPSLFISERCPRLIFEIGRYRVDPKSVEKFAVIKVDDHVLDSMRYALMLRAWDPYTRGEASRPRKGGFNPNYEEAWRPSDIDWTDSGPLGSFA